MFKLKQISKHQSSTREKFRAQKSERLNGIEGECKLSLHCQWWYDFIAIHLGVLYF